MTKDINYYRSLNVFDSEQMWQIMLGLEKGLDVSIYANPEFDSEQMDEIRLKLLKDKENKEEVVVKDIFDEVKEILMKRGEDYGDVKNNYEKIAKIWSAILEKKVSASQVILCMISLKINRESFKHKKDNIIDIIGYLYLLNDFFLKNDSKDIEYYESLNVFDSEQMEEIRWGLEKGLNVSIYAKPEFNWRQMRQIRLGLEDGLDVSIYAKPEFNDDQMYQIREGLEVGLDVSVFAKLEFNDDQMYRIRIKLLKEKKAEEGIND